MATEQALAALKEANRVRLRRARMRREIKAGAAASPYLLNPPAWLQGAPVSYLVISLPRVGVKRAARFLRDAAQLSTKRTFRSSTERQRRCLHDLLAKRVATYR